MGRFDSQSVAVRSGRFDAFSDPVEQEQQAPPFLGFLNRAIAGSVGAPVDLVNAGLSLMGFGAEQPVGGSKSIEALMGVAGVELPAEGQKPTTIGQRVERGVGETVGALLPFGGVAAGVARGAGAAGQVARSITEGVARAPVLATAADIASGAASGVGTQVAAEQFPDNDAAEALGALAGGLSPAALAGIGGVAARVAKALPGTGALIRGAQGAVTPFTKAGGTVRAEARAQSLVSDPQGVAARLQTERPISDLTVAQQTGERRLLSLEREVLNKDVSLESEFAEQTAGATNQLRADLEVIGTGDVGDTRSFIEKRRARLTSALELRAKEAATEAQRRIAQITPERRASESSVIVRDEIEKALGSARAQENVLWNEVPQDIQVPTEATITSYEAFRGQLSRAQLDDMPDIARRFLGGGNESFQSEETVKEMHGLYSKLREESRIARAANEFNTARISDGIADGILDDIDAAEGAGAAFDVARSFSRELNQKFSQGAVGRVLGRGRAGAPTVAPELTLQTTVGRGGDRGAVEAMEILRAAPAAQSEIGQFILGRFQQGAIKNGRLNPQAAREFVRESNFLDSFPDLRQNMLNAAEAAETAAVRGARAERVTKSLASVNRSKTGEFLGARPGEEISRVIRSKSPGSAARELRRQVRKDPTGQALAGLKAATIDHLILKSETGAFDDFGERLLSGNAVRAALKDKSTMAAVSEILTPDEIGRVKRIAAELTKIEKSGGRLPDIGGIVADAPAAILDVVVKVMGARQGAAVSRAVGGGGIQIPQIFSSRAKKLLGSLTNDTAKELLIEAVKDKQLMAALLSPTTTVPQTKVAGRRLNAWLIGPGKRFAESLEDDGDDSGFNVN